MDPNEMHIINSLDDIPADGLDMLAWADDELAGDMPALIFATKQTVQSFAADGSDFNDLYLESLKVSGWAAFDDLPGWADSAPGWTASLDVRADRLVMTGPGGVQFYEGGIGSSKRWRREARRNGTFVAFAGDFNDPTGIPAAVAGKRLWALLCPVTLHA